MVPIPYVTYQTFWVIVLLHYDLLLQLVDGFREHKIARCINALASVVAALLGRLELSLRQSFETLGQLGASSRQTAVSTSPTTPSQAATTH